MDKSAVKDLGIFDKSQVCKVDGELGETSEESDENEEKHRQEFEEEVYAEDKGLIQDGLRLNSRTARSEKRKRAQRGQRVGEPEAEDVGRTIRTNQIVYMPTQDEVD